MLNQDSPEKWREVGSQVKFQTNHCVRLKSQLNFSGNRESDMCAFSVEKLLSNAINYQNKGNYDEAIKSYNHILEHNSLNLTAMNNLSVLYINSANLEKAEKLLLKIVNNGFLDENILNHLSVVYMRTYRFEEALKMLDHAMQMNPFKIETYLNLTNVCSTMKKTDLAIHYALEGVKIDPGSSLAFNNLGSIFNSMAMFNEARIAFETACALDKKNIEPIVNLGTIHSRFMENDMAIKMFSKALRLLPKNAKSQSDVIKFLLGFELLKKGDLELGWKYYDCGFHPNIPKENSRTPPRQFNKPIWDGSKIEGKTILIWREQGLGDEILFYSCLPDLIRYHDGIILEVDKRLVDIIQRSFPNIVVREQNFGPPPYFDSTYQDYDYHLPLASLMRHFRKSLQDFKTSGYKLKPDVNKKQYFSNLLSPYKEKIIIGICWRSGNIDPLRAMNYLSIMKCGELFSMNDVVWVNLQYGDCEKECIEAENEYGIEIIRWPNLNLKDDLDDVFALISELDYVITVGTAVQTMAASLGVETLLISPPEKAWHNFGLDYDPWFPNIHTFTADYKNLAEALPFVKKHIIEHGKKSK